MPDVGFQLYMMRAPNSGLVSGLAYGSATKWIFSNPDTGVKYYQAQNVVDLNGALPGEEVEIKVVRDGSDGTNTTASNATAILLEIAIPTKDTQ